MGHLFPIEHFELDLTNHCNLRCEYCFHYGDLEAPKGYMPTDLAHRIIDEAADKGLARSISSSIFGEALLHKDFFEIAGHAMERGLSVTLNTNGILLETDTLEKLYRLNPDKVIISLNTPDSKSLPIKHAPVRFTIDEYVGRIEEAFRLKVKFESKTKLYLYLFNTYFSQPRGLDVLGDDEMAREAVAHWRGVADRVASEFGVAGPSSDEWAEEGTLVGRKWPIDRGITLLEDVELIFKEAHYWGNRMLGPNLEAVPTTKGFCPLPWEMLAIHWTGDCTICCLDYNKEIVIGNLHEQSLEEIFVGDRIAEIRTEFKAGRVTEPLCQICLGGIRDKTTGEMVKAPQTSKAAHLLNAVKKYGVKETVAHGLRSLGERLP